MHHLSKIKRVPYLIWYSKHEFTHVLIGLVYAWFLRELWGEFNLGYGILAVAGSLVIDLDHVLFYFTYGRNEPYAKDVRKFLKSGQFGTLFKYCQDNHKYNTSLASHNVYVVGLFILLSLLSFFFDWKSRLALFGAIVLHLLFDMFDDLWALGYFNENWKRLRRNKAHS